MINRFSYILVTLLLLFITGCKEESVSKERRLIIYNWEDYIGSKTIEEFTQKTGIITEIRYFHDEEEMFAEIRSNTSEYDLVVASDDLIREMILAKVLLRLDLKKIPNIKNIAKDYLNLEFDPDNIYSIPYLWGTTGMVVNRKYIKGNSWSILFNNDYSNRVAMLNNSSEVLSASLKFMSKSINPYTRTDVDMAIEKLEGQKNINRGYYDVISIKEMLISEELWAAQIYSGEGMSAADENDNLEYLIPEEGAPIWLDSFAIPKNSQNVDEAHLFLDFILDGEINGKISSELWYATSNREALKYVESEVLDSGYVYPSKEILEKCEYYRDIGELSNYINMKWSELENSDTN